MPGIGTITAAEMFSEQVELKGRTTDPTNAQPGEYWIRTDQTSSDPQVVAELRRQDTDGVTAIPLFDESEGSNLGSDVVRGPSVVLGDGTVGFVAQTTGPGAEYGSPRGVTAAGEEYLSHNSLELSNIPDNEDLYAWFEWLYLAQTYADQDGISQWDGESSNNESITQSDSSLQPVMDADGLDGHESAEFTNQNGSSTEGTHLDDGSLPTLDQTDGVTLVAYVLPNANNSGFSGLVGPDIQGAEDELLLSWDGDYRVKAGGDITATDPADGQPHTIIASLYDDGGGFDLTLYIDGSSKTTTSINSPSFSVSSIKIGEYLADNGNYYTWGGEIALAGAYAVGKSASKVSEIHNYIVNL